MKNLLGFPLYLVVYDGTNWDEILVDKSPSNASDACQVTVEKKTTKKGTLYRYSKLRDRSLSLLTVVILHNSFRLDFIPLVHSLFVLFDNWQPAVPRRSWDKREQQQSWEFPELLDTLCIPNWYNRLVPEHPQTWPIQNPVVVLPYVLTSDVPIELVVR